MGCGQKTLEIRVIWLNVQQCKCFVLIAMQLAILFHCTVGTHWSQHISCSGQPMSADVTSHEMLSLGQRWEYTQRTHTNTHLERRCAMACTESRAGRVFFSSWSRLPRNYNNNTVRHSARNTSNNTRECEVSDRRQQFWLGRQHCRSGNNDKSEIFWFCDIWYVF